MHAAHGNGDDAGERRRLVNWGELLATCAASALAMYVLSRLGVAGTVVGAAVTPLIITLTTTALSNEADRAREAAGQLDREDGRRLALDPERRRRLTAALATAAAATGILVAGIAFAEAVTDEPIDEWGRDGGSASRPGGRAPRESPTPTGDPSPAGHASPTPTATTPAPTATATGTPAPSPTSTAPSASPTAAPSPAAQP